MILVCGNAAFTPKGLNNTGWSEFETVEECEKEWGLINNSQE